MSLRIIYGRAGTGKSEYWKANNIYDLAGNVREWTQEEGSSYIYHTYRGGTYIFDGDDHPAAYRVYIYSTNTYDELGFRASFYL